MTDLLEPCAPTRPGGLPPLTTTAEPAPFLAWLLAACLAGAGIIHLAMAPGHMTAWKAEGVAFLLTALLQLGLALGLVLRPRRWMVAVAVVSSIAFIGAWWWSRYEGMPWGPDAHFFEDATVIDVTCVVLEGVIAAAGLVTLARPRLTGSWGPSAKVIASILPIAALVAASAAVASPSAAGHAHSGAGANDAPHRDDLDYWKLSNGHHHPITTNVLDPATQTELDRQLQITREVALVYPTVASAEAAGYRRAGPYSPGLGSHYTRSGAAELNPDGIMDDEDLRHPLSIIYDGNEPDSVIAGYMYYSMSATEPAGFVGGNDTWHYHTSVCIKVTPEGIDSPFGADLPVTQQQCAAVGGLLLPQTQWMVHVWTIPGYDDLAGGVFAEDNPELACSDGTYTRVAQDDWADHPINICDSGAPGEPRYDVTSTT